MKTGKISESILKRSVIGKIKDHREETKCTETGGELLKSLPCSIEKGAGVGEDCAFLAWENTCFSEEGKERKILVAVSTQTVALPIKRGAYLAVMAAANNLAASGARASAITLSLTIPREMEEDRLKELMDQTEECCRELKVQIIGGHTEVSANVRAPVITATAIGTSVGKRCGYEERKNTEELKQLDIVISKWIGLEGTTVIVQEKEEELLKRFSSRFLAVAKEQERYLSVAGEAAIALKSNVYAMHDVRNGGIFGALWELSQKLGVGLSINLKKIPVRQETIEICEFFNLSPYELLSGGALIMATEDGSKLVRELEAAKVPAALIGYTDKSNDKIVTNGEETRYLGSPGPDEIHKLIF